MYLLDEFNCFLSTAATTIYVFLITGDFHNIAYKVRQSHRLGLYHTSPYGVLSSFNLTQHVNFPTHNKNHILDLVITSSDSFLTTSLSMTYSTPSGHIPISKKLTVDCTPLPLPTVFLSNFAYAWL